MRGEAWKLLLLKNFLPQKFQRRLPPEEGLTDQVFLPAVQSARSALEQVRPDEDPARELAQDLGFRGGELLPGLQPESGRRLEPVRGLGAVRCGQDVPDEAGARLEGERLAGAGILNFC